MSRIYDRSESFIINGQEYQLVLMESTAMNAFIVGLWRWRGAGNFDRSPSHWWTFWDAPEAHAFFDQTLACPEPKILEMTL